MTTRKAPPSNTPAKKRYTFTASSSSHRPFDCSRLNETPFLTADRHVTNGSLSAENPYSAGNGSASSSSSTTTSVRRPAPPGSTCLSGGNHGNRKQRTRDFLSTSTTPVMSAVARRTGTGEITTVHSSEKTAGYSTVSSYFSTTSTEHNRPSDLNTGGNQDLQSLETDVMDGRDIQHLRSFDTERPGDMSSDSQVCLSLLWHAGRLGVAYYDLETTQINIMLDAVETDNFKLVHRVLTQVNPTTVVLSAKQDERLVKAVKSYVKGDDVEVTPEQGTCQIDYLPSIEFSVELCKRRVLCLDLPSVPNHYSETERTLFLSSLVPFENVHMVRALGGLLKYLEKMRVGVELEEAGVRVPVLGINIVSVDSQMILDDTAYSALQIFQKEAHPSVYKAGNSQGAKEGLSLFGILNRCKSQIGSRMLRTWFLRPLKDPDMLQQRYEAISYFTNPRNAEVVRTLEESVKNVKNISKTLTRMVQSQASVGDWQGFYKTVYSAVTIKEVCRTLPRTIQVFKKVTEIFTDDLQKLTQIIHRIVDFEESLVQGRFVVKQHVDDELDEKKRTFGGLPDFMTKVANEELKRLREDITECTVLYMPQVGYLLAIPTAAIKFPISAEDDYHIEGLQFVFFSNNVLHYKSDCTSELDKMLGDTRCDITDLEITIMHKLQDIILQHSKCLLSVLDCTAELDCLLSLASCAREYNYVRPTITNENVIDIVAGRHPIQEMCCSTFVPNDVMSNGEYGKMKVLTGPNACGKSVYLKQVALIVFLAQIGSFVPAESATIGLIDRIFTRVRSLESVSVGLSTFMIDINQMSEALRCATDRSLCIIDEFGKGTDLVDGVALLCSCLSHWAEQGSCPHVFVSTHFHSIIHQHLLPKSPLIKYMTFETLHNGEELVFLYQLTEGHTNSSYACHVAAQVGLPVEVVTRGMEVSELIRQGKPVHRVDRVETETQLKRCSTVVNKFLEIDLEKGDVRSFLSDFVLPTVEGNL